MDHEITTQESCHSAVQVHENVEAVKLYSKVDGGTLYFLPPFLSPPFLISLLSLFPPLRSDPLYPARRSVDSEVARGLKGGTRKNGLTGDLSRAPYARVWRGIRGPSLPPKKNEFGIGGGAISACIEGLLAFFGLFLVDILSRSQFLSTPPHRISFYANFDKLRNP